MNLTRLPIVLIISVCTCAHLSPVYSQQVLATSSADKNVESIARKLYTPGYADFQTTRESLRSLAKGEETEVAVKARHVLDDFSTRADRWLQSVGNTREWQRYSKDVSLPLGQGRVRGSKSAGQPPSKLWIELKEATPLESMAYLYSYGPINQVSATGEYIVDDHLVYLSGFGDLEIIDIDNASVTGIFLARIDVPRLRFLHLRNCPVRDGAIPDRVLERLSTADFSGTMVSSATIRKLSPEHIGVLRVANTSVDEAGLLWLHGARNLMRLSVECDDLTPKLISMLSDLKSLRDITIHYTEEQANLAEELAGKFPSRISVRLQSCTLGERLIVGGD